jgi:hypothetical protein
MAGAFTIRGAITVIGVKLRGNLCRRGLAPLVRFGAQRTLFQKRNFDVL